MFFENPTLAAKIVFWRLNCSGGMRLNVCVQKNEMLWVADHPEELDGDTNALL